LVVTNATSLGAIQYNDATSEAKRISNDSEQVHLRT